MAADFDLLVGPVGCLVPCAGPAPRLGDHLKTLPTFSPGALGVREGRVAYAGPWPDVRDASAAARVALPDGTLLPGFVDPHTHVPFLGDRANELRLRLEGATYMEIGRAGGGILRTMRSVRGASRDELHASARRLADRFLGHGVTTFEAKSGYGLNEADEIKQLEVIRRLGEEGPQTVASTFLGAHFVPPEYKESPSAYVDLLVEVLLPRVAREGLARFCDVFCEDGAFTPEQSRRILLAARDLGLMPRIHADEIVDTGGAALAAEVGAVSADHLMAASEAGIEAMARAGVCATFLPGTSFYLRKPYAPARAFVQAGCPIALSTDCNPGSSYTTNLLHICTLAVFGMGLLPEEALWAVTLNSAYSLRLHGEVGSLEVGKRADFTLWDAPDYLHLFYPYGEARPAATYCKGRQCWSKVSA
jgi:imidazolonepropionase